MSALSSMPNFDIGCYESLLGLSLYMKVYQGFEHVRLLIKLCRWYVSRKSSIADCYSWIEVAYNKNIFIVSLAHPRFTGEYKDDFRCWFYAGYRSNVIKKI